MEHTPPIRLNLLYVSESTQRAESLNCYEEHTLKFAAIIEYGQDKEKVKALHPAHREYLRRFL